jgi:large subunit ribosomal protein L25
MTKKIDLAATTRTVIGKKVKRNRLKGLMPAVVYGHGTDTKPLFIGLKEFKKVYNEAGTSTLVNLTVDGEKSVKVLLHEPDIHYLSGEPVHVDFYAVKMTEKIDTAIPISYVGVAPAVEELEGNFITNKDELQIRCFPGDLISEVEVDISVLATFDDQIKVTDIKVPETIEVLDDPEEVLALVAAPITEEELEADLVTESGEEAEAAAVEELAGEEEATTEGEEPKDKSDDNKSE